MQRGRVTSETLQTKYSVPLTYAAHGDLEFLKSQNSRRQFSEDEIAVFQDYAFAASRLRQFQEANNRLIGVLNTDRNGELTIDNGAMKSFHKYMQKTSKSTKSFDDFVMEHSRQGVGHKFYLKTKQAIRKINSIDNQHLPIDKFIRDITPEAFGSTLHVFNSHEQIKHRASNMYSSSEAIEFKEEPSLFKEAAHVLGKKAQKVYTANKAKVRGVMIGAACLATILGGASYLNDRAAFKDLDVKTNVQQGYQNHVSAETINKLSEIRLAIENAKNSPTQPTFNDLSEIRQSLDNVIDDVMSDLVTDAFEEKNPDCKVSSVETAYDKTVNMYNNGEPHPENFCTITYTDEKGEEKKVVIHEFASLAGDPITQSFDNEYNLDGNSPSVDEKDDFIAQGKAVQKILEEYEKILEDTEHLAGTQMVYSGGFLFTDPSLKTILPEKSKDLQTEKTEVSDTQLAKSNETAQKTQDDDFGEK